MVSHALELISGLVGMAIGLLIPALLYFYFLKEPEDSGIEIKTIPPPGASVD